MADAESIQLTVQERRSLILEHAKNEALKRKAFFESRQRTGFYQPPIFKKQQRMSFPVGRSPQPRVAPHPQNSPAFKSTGHPSPGSPLLGAPCPRMK